MYLIALAAVIVGIFFWVATIKSFLDEPGYGGFDMTTASAFDLGWAKGAIFLGAGVGMLAHSLPVGSLVGVGGFLASMLVKPALAKFIATRIMKPSATADEDQPPSGFAALHRAEREATSCKSSTSERPDPPPRRRS